MIRRVHVGPTHTAYSFAVPPGAATTALRIVELGSRGGAELASARVQTRGQNIVDCWRTGTASSELKEVPEGVLSRRDSFSSEEQQEVRVGGRHRAAR